MEKRNWTPEQVEELKRRLLAGEKPETIAVALGYGLSAVKSKLHREGFAVKLPPLERKTLVDRHKRGWAPSRIARQINVDVAFVEKFIREQGL